MRVSTVVFPVGMIAVLVTAVILVSCDRAGGVFPSPGSSIEREDRHP